VEFRSRIAEEVHDRDRDVVPGEIKRPPSPHYVTMLANAFEKCREIIDMPFLISINDLDVKECFTTAVQSTAGVRHERCAFVDTLGIMGQVNPAPENDMGDSGVVPPSAHIAKMLWCEFLPGFDVVYSELEYWSKDFCR
jgi:hypothetical protein